MSSDKLSQKRVIVNKLASSGINITPETLELIMSFENPIDMLNSIIKETSFIPSFNSYLTINILQKISNEEIQKMLKRVISKDIFFDDLARFPKIEDNSETLYESSQTTGNSQIEAPIKMKHNLNTTLENEASSTKPPSIESVIPAKKKKKSKLYDSARSSLQFKPIAKDFESSYEILKDPTGKLYTTGDYDDFYNLTVDKYNKLKLLMRKRPEMKAATNINNIF
ncbi:MAG: hypothetical protein ACFFKA_08060, partial [Candidatus Thorarchaeota archaeon]